MESRKLQFTGRSTYVVSLPKRWIRERGLKAGDRVLIEQGENGELILRPDAATEPRQEVKRLDITGASPRQIERRIISAYLSGFDELRIVCRHRILPEQREAVTRILRRILGTEILAESPHEIVINDLLDFKDIYPRNILRRMHVITEFMLKNAVEAFFSSDTELARDVAARDDEVDKFYLLATKEIMEGVKRKGSLRLDMPPEMAIHHLSVARCLERIADHSVKIAKVLLSGWGRCMAEPEDELRKLYSLVMRCFELAMKSFFSGDAELADRVLDEREKVEGLVSEILKQVKQGAPGIYILLDSLQRVYAYSADIAECTLDLEA
ncbi:MAG: AbrB/MazE/SpoVT family DNA-binding domain-containing protein [Euryarchaeota archaeon]|nr:AbrB/MazE/SpoVT family DNA-binding domain-containing protein [Euryarchaeota archaeon]